jgi:hypothetical protein
MPKEQATPKEDAIPEKDATPKEQAMPGKQPASAGGAERRRYPRVRDDSLVAVTVLASPDVPELVNRTFFCHSEDLSVSGIRIHVPAMLPSKASLILRIAFAAPLKAFRRFGTVAWCRPTDDEEIHDAGVEFAVPSSESEDDWLRVLDKKVEDGEVI